MRIFAFTLVGLMGMAAAWLFLWPSLTARVESAGIAFSVPSQWVMVNDWVRRGEISTTLIKRRVPFSVDRSTDVLSLDESVKSTYDEIGKNGEASPIQDIEVGGYPGKTFSDWTSDVSDIHSGGGMMTVGLGRIYERRIRVKINPSESIDIGCEFSNNPFLRLHDDILCRRIVSTIRFDPASPKQRR